MSKFVWTRKEIVISTPLTLEELKKQYLSGEITLKQFISLSAKVKTDARL